MQNMLEAQDTAKRQMSVRKIIIALFQRENFSSVV